MGESSAGGPVDSVGRPFSALSAYPRRLVLVMVHQRGDCTIGDVTSRSDRSPDELELALVHTHLPKLVAAGYVDWDRAAGEITRGPQFERVAPLLDVLQNNAGDLPFDQTVFGTG